MNSILTPRTETFRNISYFFDRPEDSGFIDKVVKLVGWGQVNDEIWKDDPNLIPGVVTKDTTSCITTNDGPFESHYKPCDIEWVKISF